MFLLMQSSNFLCFNVNPLPLSADIFFLAMSKYIL